MCVCGWSGKCGWVVNQQQQAVGRDRKRQHSHLHRVEEETLWQEGRWVGGHFLFFIPPHRTYIFHLAINLSSSPRGARIHSENNHKRDHMLLSTLQIKFMALSFFLHDATVLPLPHTMYIPIFISRTIRKRKVFIQTENGNSFGPVCQMGKNKKNENKVGKSLHLVLLLLWFQLFFYAYRQLFLQNYFNEIWLYLFVAKMGFIP